MIARNLVLKTYFVESIAALCKLEYLTLISNIPFYVSEIGNNKKVKLAFSYLYKYVTKLKRNMSAYKLEK